MGGGDGFLFLFLSSNLVKSEVRLWDGWGGSLHF